MASSSSWRVNRVANSGSTIGTNIVQRLLSPTLIGRNNNINIRQHYGARIHLTWNARYYSQRVNRTNDSANLLTTIAETSQICIVRRFVSEANIIRLRNQLSTLTIHGVCTCRRQTTSLEG
jgi:hypothetical protein